MYNEALRKHTNNFNPNRRSIDKSYLIEMITELTANNIPSRPIIQSTDLSDIIENSPYLLHITVGLPVRSLNDRISTEWGSRIIYHATVHEVLKGSELEDSEITIIFPAFWVRFRESHIVAVEKIGEGGSWFRLTAENGILSVEQRDEILNILRSE